LRIFIKFIKIMKIKLLRKDVTIKKVKGKGMLRFEWGGGGSCLGVFLCGFFVCCSGVRGGGKCPEEEHTTCSGGPTINCHKRGLWGEMKELENKIFSN
jgi:hypothetical protein